MPSRRQRRGALQKGGRSRSIQEKVRGSELGERKVKRTEMGVGI